MSARTVFLSRLIGLFLLLFSLSMLLHGRASAEIVNRLAKDPPLLMLMGMLALLGGLAMVLSHNLWSGGFVPVVVTVLGWVLTLRGLATLLIPPDAMARLMQSARFEDRPFPIPGDPAHRRRRANLCRICGRPSLERSLGVNGT